MGRPYGIPADEQKCQDCGNWARPKGTAQSFRAFRCGPCYLLWKRAERKRLGLK